MRWAPAWRCSISKRELKTQVDIALQVIFMKYTAADCSDYTQTVPLTFPRDKATIATVGESRSATRKTHDSWSVIFLAPAFAAAVAISGPVAGRGPTELCRALALPQSPSTQSATPTLLACQHHHGGAAGGRRWHLGLVFAVQDL